MKTLDKLQSGIKHYIESLTQGGFQQVFSHIDQLGIKKGVDKLGLEKFIEQCAWMAAGSGALSGSGGIVTLMVGVPVDFINLVTQQFRITMAIMYHQRGSYEVSFGEFMSIVAESFKIEAGLVVTKNMMEAIAERMLAILGTRTAERMIPVVGGLIGGTANYMFIKRMARSIRKMEFEPVTVIAD